MQEWYSQVLPLVRGEDYTRASVTVESACSQQTGGINTQVLLPFHGLRTECLWDPPPQFICWSPNTECDDIQRWDLWEVIGSGESWGWDPHNGISTLIRESLLYLSLCHVTTHWESLCFQVRKRVTPEPNHACILISYSHPSEWWENQFLVLKHASLKSPC